MTEQVEVVETEVPNARVREDLLDVVRERVAKANKRLAKAGQPPAQDGEL